MHELKRLLRGRLRRRRLDLLTRSRSHAERRITDALITLTRSVDAQTVGVYAALPGEVSLDAFATACLEQGRRVAWPRVAEDATLSFHWIQELTSLTSGYKGIREPPVSAPTTPPDRLELLVLPGLAFDRFGRRLGQGGGYYDKVLSLPVRPRVTCGVAYACQILPRVPAAAHDRPVDTVITEIGRASEGTWR